MASIEVDGSRLVARAEEEGVQGVVLDGVLKFDPKPDGVAVVLELTSVGPDSDWTPAVKDLIARTVLQGPLVIRHGKTETEAGQHNALRVNVLKRLPRLRSIHERSLGGPRRVES